MKSIKYTGLLVAVAFTSSFAQDAQPLEKASTLTASASLDVASASIYDSGTVLSDSLVLQPAFSIGFDAFDAVPLTFGTWANYATDKLDPMTQNHCFTEVDLSLGTSYSFDNGPDMAFALSTWQYPNMEAWNGEELLFASVSKSVGVLTLGSEFELMLTGDFDNDFHVVPFAKIGTDVTDDVAVALYGQVYYYYGEGVALDGWMAYNIKASVSVSSVSLYAAYWGQMDDEMYTDEAHAVEDTVFGVGYSVSI